MISETTLQCLYSPHTYKNEEITTKQIGIFNG